MKKLLCLVLFVSVLSFVQCKQDDKSAVIGSDEMEEILYEFYVTNAMATQEYSPDDSMSYRQKAYFLAVLKKHGLTEAQFDSSMVFYYRNAKDLAEIYQNITDRLVEETGGSEEDEGDKYARFTDKGDTAHIWNSVSSAVLIPRAPLNRMDFSIKCDTALHAGDHLELYFKTLFISGGGSRDITAMVSVAYDNDSVAQQVRHVSNDAYQSLHVITDKKHKAKSIQGFFFINEDRELNGNARLGYVYGIGMVRLRQPKSDAPASSDQKVSAPDSTAVASRF